MKNKVLAVTAVIAAGIIGAAIFAGSSTNAYAFKASDDGKIHSGVFAGEIDLSGMTEEEAERAVSQYVEGLKSTEITLNAVGGNSVSVQAGTLGLVWDNKEIIEEAAAVENGEMAGTVYNDKEGQAEAMLELAYALSAGEDLEPLELENGKYIRMPYTKIWPEDVEDFRDGR